MTYTARIEVLEPLKGLTVAADAVILLITEITVNSESIKLQLQYAHDRQDLFIIPILLEDIRVPSYLEDLLGDRLWINEKDIDAETAPSNDVIDLIVQTLEKNLSGSDGRIQPSKSFHFEGNRPLNEGKLILVGRGEVGKTSIVKRLTQNQFRGDESKTQGINITTWSISSNNDKIRLNIWDFGGQEIMHATHQFFLTERSIYLLVLNGREGGEDKDAEYWLKHIESFGGDSPVIIVQNKIAQHAFELNYRGSTGKISKHSRICKNRLQRGYRH